MKIGIAFYGIVDGERPSVASGPIGSNRDIRHCWPDHKKMLIDPFIEQGHEVSTYITSYTPGNEIGQYISNDIKPTTITYLDKSTSDPFTTKGSCLKNLYEENLDFVIICRIDMHLSKVIAQENIGYDKFNFLFKELEWWDKARFTTDNFYMFPHSMIEIVDKALHDTYCYPRGFPFVDTHGLYDKLINYISKDDIHFVSDIHELSDINSYYTVCRTNLPLSEERLKIMHPSVKEHFYGDI